MRHGDRRAFEQLEHARERHRRRPGDVVDAARRGSEREQNRANDVSSQLQVLAEEVPLLSGKLSLVSSGAVSLLINGGLGER